MTAFPWSGDAHLNASLLNNNNNNHSNNNNTSSSSLINNHAVHNPNSGATNGTTNQVSSPTPIAGDSIPAVCTSSATTALAVGSNMPVGGVQSQNPTQGLVHWMSAVMAEHMTSNSHHDPTVGMHYMWNGGVDVSIFLSCFKCYAYIDYYLSDALLVETIRYSAYWKCRNGPPSEQVMDFPAHRSSSGVVHVSSIHTQRLCAWRAQTISLYSSLRLLFLLAYRFLISFENYCITPWREVCSVDGWCC